MREEGKKKGGGEEEERDEAKMLRRNQTVIKLLSSTPRGVHMHTDMIAYTVMHGHTEQTNTAPV